MEAVRQPHLQADRVTIKTKSCLMLTLVAQLVPLIEQIKAYDKEIANRFLTHADSHLFDSLPGAGKRLVSRMPGRMGDDRKRSADTRSIQAPAGTCPVPWKSGEYARVHQRFACVKPLRNALYHFAWLSTQQETWANNYSQRKRTEGKSHSMAVRALANVWMRVIFALWHKHEVSQRAIF